LEIFVPETLGFTGSETTRASWPCQSGVPERSGRDAIGALVRNGFESDVVDQEKLLFWYTEAMADNKRKHEGRQRLAVW